MNAQIYGKEAKMMNNFANLPPESIKRIQLLEDELCAQGHHVVLVAYDKYAKLSDDQIEEIQELEKKFKEQYADVVLLAYNK